MTTKPSMKKIADTLGISVNAVSLALNGRPGVSDNTRNLVLETAEAIGYFDEKEKYRSGFEERHIGVVISRGNYTSRFYTRVLYGIEKCANTMGYFVIIKFLDDENLQEYIARHKFCGLLIVGIVPEETIAELSRYNVPVVLIDNDTYHDNYDCVMTDNRIGTSRAVKYLYDHGFRKIGYMGDFAYSHSNRERYWGYYEAVMQHFGNDLQKANDYAARYSIVSAIDPFIIEKRQSEITALLQQKEELPEAYQCANDENAAVLCNALRSLGYRVPEDISVIGFDDDELIRLVAPGITTLAVHTDRMGEVAFRRLIDRVKNRGLELQKIVLPVELVERSSVRSPQTSEGSGGTGAA